MNASPSTNMVNSPKWYTGNCWDRTRQRLTDCLQNGTQQMMRQNKTEAQRLPLEWYTTKWCDRTRQRLTDCPQNSTQQTAETEQDKGLQTASRMVHRKMLRQSKTEAHKQPLECYTVNWWDRTRQRLTDCLQNGTQENAETDQSRGSLTASRMGKKSWALQERMKGNNFPVIQTKQSLLFIPYDWRINNNNQKCSRVFLPVEHSVTELISWHDKSVSVIGKIAERQKVMLLNKD